VKYFFLIVTLLTLVGCSNKQRNISPNILKDSWIICQSVNDAPNYQPYEGKAILVWNRHPQYDDLQLNPNVHSEEYNGIILNNAQYFILGDYEVTSYYSEYDINEYLTLNEDEVGAILCANVNYTDIELCEYTNDFYIIRTIAEVDVKLINWANQNLIAEKRITTSTPNYCYPNIKSNQKGKNLILMNNIDVWEWLLKYKK
jgi:hypothetical protein